MPHVNAANLHFADGCSSETSRIHPDDARAINFKKPDTHHSRGLAVQDADLKAAETSVVSHSVNSTLLRCVK
ncbi:hypothetical protein [Paraburkholderia hospita]|nr:hypothetical protein [Paraburkholderia hospita]